MNRSIKIKFWGVRGSIPSPGPKTIYYGGNTSCVEIQFPGKPKFILDAGSGIRELGKELLQSSNPVKAYIFISHFHWDHIQGLPFFKPAFKPGNHFIIYGCDEPNVNLSEIISMQMNPTYFPLAVEDMRAHVEFRTVQEETFMVEGVEVKTKFLNHPGYALGYRFTLQGKSIVYISDNEPFVHPLIDDGSDKEQSDSIAARFEKFVEDLSDELVRFVEGANILIHDTQYFPEEYERKRTWGHSPLDYTVDIAIRAKIKKLVLFHHDPDHDDDTIHKMVQQSRDLLKRNNNGIVCEAAREGAIIELISGKGKR